MTLAHDPSLPGVAAPDTTALDAWTLRAGRLAVSAERAVALFPEVLSARYDIAGTPAAPVATVHVTVRDGADNDAVIETLTVKVLRDMEALLGLEFAQRHLHVAVRRDETFDGVGVVAGA